MIRTALLSVSDKNGIVPFAKALHEQGIKLISTGGTAKLLAENQLPVVEVSSLTKFPEMLDGRVKTLHPMVHGGLLARRDFPEHMTALKEHGIDTIDMLVINLYPFNETVAKADCSFEDAVENIDIGGPSMLRSAAKNHLYKTVITDIADYETLKSEMQKNEIINTSREQIKEVIEITLDKKVRNSGNYDTKQIDLLIKDSLDKYICYYMKSVYGYPSKESKQELTNYINKKIQELVNKQLGELSASIIANIIRELSK